MNMGFPPLLVRESEMLTRISFGPTVESPNSDQVVQFSPPQFQPRRRTYTHFLAFDVNVVDFTCFADTSHPLTLEPVIQYLHSYICMYIYTAGIYHYLVRNIRSRSVVWQVHRFRVFPWQKYTFSSKTFGKGIKFCANEQNLILSYPLAFHDEPPW